MSLSNSNVRLSLIIPAFNEAGRIGRTLEIVIPYLNSRDYPCELIVVDDGSSDNTKEIVCSRIEDMKGAGLISYARNMGKGYAVRQGVLQSKGEWVIFTDADLSTPIEEVEPALSFLQKGHDIVIGSRKLPQSDIPIPQPLYRRTIARVINFLIKAVVGLTEFHDTQCGFKAFKGEVARKVFSSQKINGLMFDAEVLYLAKRMGLNIIEMPVRWADDRGSRLRITSHALRTLMDIVKIRRMHR